MEKTKMSYAEVPKMINKDFELRLDTLNPVNKVRELQIEETKPVNNISYSIKPYEKKERDVGKLAGKRDVGKLAGECDAGKLAGKRDVGKLRRIQYKKRCRYNKLLRIQYPYRQSKNTRRKVKRNIFSHYHSVNTR